MSLVHLGTTLYLGLALGLSAGLILGFGLGNSSDITLNYDDQAAEFLAEYSAHELTEQTAEFVRTIEVDAAAARTEFLALQARRDQFAENSAAVTTYLEQEGLTDNYGIIFRDLNDPELNYEFRADEEFWPLSIYKVPLTMLALKASERGELDLDTLVTHEQKQRSIREVLELMITETNNPAMAVIESQLGGYNRTQELLRSELGVRVDRRNQITTPQDIAVVFESIYEFSYLRPEENELLLEWLFNPLPSLRLRIPAAVERFNAENNTDLTVAEKVGTWDGIYSDAGIIFGDGNSDYLLIIMNERRTVLGAREEIDIITNQLLEGLEPK